LFIVETSEEFKGMLWGKFIAVYTYNKIPSQDGLWLSSYHVFHWRFFLEDMIPLLYLSKASTKSLQTPSHDWTMVPSRATRMLG
jgi:hypothetical protein